jgi:N-methylhydantoinase A
VDAARRALEKVARPFEVDVVQAAWGIHQVVNENMANASRVHTVQRGHDPKAYSMVAFGGAGPVHAFGVAGKLGLRTIVVPFGAGVTSAAGFLMVPFAFNFVRSYVGRLHDLEPAHLSAIFEEMEAAGRARLTTAGVPDEQITFTRSCDIRYVGQGFEVSVPLPNEPFDVSSLETVRSVFEREYQRQFARINPHTDIESLNWRVVASGPEPTFSLKKESADGRSLSAALKKHRPVFLGDDFLQCPVYDHYGLFPGARFDGPAIVEDIESTTVVGHGATVSVDEYLNLKIDRHE